MASAYLLELDQLREKLLSEVIDQLGISGGSSEHELSLAFATKSLAHHDHLDAEAYKVETTICSVAEKFLMQGEPVDATRLLLLSSGLTGKPMRLDGHRMVRTTAGAVPSTPLEHPYGALALLLALSGSQRWVVEGEEEDNEEEEVFDEDRSKGNVLVSNESELACLGGETSRLWSTDSSGSEEEEETEGGGPSHGAMYGGGLLTMSEPTQGGPANEGDTQEWLTAFENDDASDSTARTDDEGYATGGSEADLRRVGGNDDPALRVPTSQAAESVTASSRVPATNVSARGRCAAVRHRFGAPCVGADIRSLGSDGGATHFLRACQTLEACQANRPTGVLRRRSIPEAEVIRAALHMLQGLAGDIFVRINVYDDGSGGGAVDTNYRQTGDGGGGGGGGGGEVRGAGHRGCSESHGRFALSAKAAGDLAVLSLSPGALTAVLGEFVRMGNVAEYLRCFVADAEALTSAAATSRTVYNATTAPPRENTYECKHGHTTQAFAACVRRQLEAFEDAVAERDRRLYDRQQQRGLEHGILPTAVDRERRSNGLCQDGGASDETTLGLLSLLKREARSLELTRRLVEDGAGWWTDTAPVEGTRPGKGAGGLRERTRRLLAALHGAVVSDALVRGPVGDHSEFDEEALAPLRRGWLLSLFCEVLTPYLRLIDAWITKGKIVDPHGELFFSQRGAGAGVVGEVGGYGGRKKGSAKRGGGSEGSPAYGDGGVDVDPVVHVWDTGIVLHSRALPSFLAPLAPAVALAGQDISLMRKVRALVASSSDASLDSGEEDSGTPMRSGLSCGLRSRTSEPGVRRPPDSESLSLATTLFESLQRLAERSRRADTTPAREQSGLLSTDDGQGAAASADVFEDAAVGNGIDGITVAASRDAPCRPRLQFSEDELGECRKRDGVDRRWDWYREDGDGDRNAAAVERPTVLTADSVAAEVDRLVETAFDGGPGWKKPTESPAKEGDDGGGGGGGGGGEPAEPPESTKTPASVAAGEAPASEGETTPIPGGDDHYTVCAGGSSVGSAAVAGGDGNGIGSGAVRGVEENLGFFGGTERLALSPDAILRQVLHPALAPPSYLPSFGGDADAGAPAPSAAVGCATGHGGVGGENRATNEIDAERLSVAAAAEDVAAVLPPTKVIESCLLAPLREHCRLASSRCLDVFVRELGVVRLVGVLRDIYLSPGGAKSHSPLSRFREVTFGLLGALVSSPSEADSRGGIPGGAVLDGVVVRDVPAFLQDGERLTSLVQSSLAMAGLERGWGRGTDATVGEGGIGDDVGECLQLPVVGGDRPLLERFSVECRPESVLDWRRRRNQVGNGRDESGFPLVGDRRCVDLRVFSCLKLECQLPWPLSVALPPRSMDKYSRTLGLLLKLEFTTHTLEESHALHSRAQRDQPTAMGELDRRHLQQTRLFAFLRVARAVRSYVVTQALVKPWSQFLARVPLCGSLQGFIRLHAAYLEFILERCFLLPRSRQTLAYIMDALQAGIAFSERYGAYVVQLDAAVGSGSARVLSEEVEACRVAGDAAKESLVRLDQLWEILLSALGFVVPLLKEMVRSRSGVHVDELLLVLDFNWFFEKQEAWRTRPRTTNA